MGIAHELSTRGWRQGETEGGDGSVCLVGAAKAAIGMQMSDGLYDYSLPDEVREALWALVDVFVNDHPCIWAWNDRPERTYDEVLRVAKMADEELGW